MTDRKLKAAVLGLNVRSQLLLEAAKESEYYEITAIADKDTELVEKTAKLYGCKGHDDFRQLIIQHQLDCIFVGAGLHSCIDYVQQAIKKKVNILKCPPAGRNFEESVELVKSAEDNGVQFSIAAISRLSDSFSTFKTMIEPGKLEHKYLLEVICNTADEVFPTWYNDRELSGGGVLLRNSYEPIDQMTLSFSLPQEVYCLTTNTADDRQQRHYLTEDTALVIFRFREDFIGILKAGKLAGMKESFLRVFGKEKTLTCRDDFITVLDNNGQMIEKKKFSFEPKACARHLLDKFALSVLWPDKNKPFSSGAEHLKNMALIESAYLSSKTGMPESVMRILEMAQIEMINP